VAGSALLALLAHQPTPASPASTPTSVQGEPSQAAATEGTLPDEQGTIIEGQALEVIDVPGYTYVRVGQSGSEGAWVAVSTAKVEVAQTVRVRADTKLENFSSSTLKREFASIYFGSLEAAGSASAQGAVAPGLPQGHVPIAGDDPHKQQAAPATVRVGQIEPAPGGRRIAQLFIEKKQLNGKAVRVRGVVVKSVDGILGKSFVHLQDGSGSSDRRDHDLTVTMAEPPKVGETLLVEGNLVADKDVGAGYRYDVLLEDVRVLERKGP
jgi:hypothetical protein